MSDKLQKSTIGKLSDGQRNRIVFAMLALQRPNMILLDEPTNHLDMESIDSLAEAINAFLVNHVLYRRACWRYKGKCNLRLLCPGAL